MPALGLARVFRNKASPLQCNSLRALWQHCLTAKARQCGDRKYLNIKGMDTCTVELSHINIACYVMVTGLLSMHNVGNLLSCRKT